MGNYQIVKDCYNSAGENYSSTVVIDSMSKTSADKYLDELYGFLEEFTIFIRGYEYGNYIEVVDYDYVKTHYRIEIQN